MDLRSSIPAIDEREGISVPEDRCANGWGSTTCRDGDQASRHAQQEVPVHRAIVAARPTRGSASLPAQSEGMVGRTAGGPAGQHGG